MSVQEDLKAIEAGLERRDAEIARMVSVHNALRARIAELEARLALAERVVRAASNVATEIEESTRGTTHWAYCEEFHPRCRWLLLLREAVAAYREETK